MGLKGLEKEKKESWGLEGLEKEKKESWGLEGLEEEKKESWVLTLLRALICRLWGTCSLKWVDCCPPLPRYGSYSHVHSSRVVGAKAGSAISHCCMSVRWAAPWLYASRRTGPLPAIRQRKTFACPGYTFSDPA